MKISQSEKGNPLPQSINTHVTRLSPFYIHKFITYHPLNQWKEMPSVIPAHNTQQIFPNWWKEVSGIKRRNALPCNLPVSTASTSVSGSLLWSGATHLVRKGKSPYLFHNSRHVFPGHLLDVISTIHQSLVALKMKSSILCNHVIIIYNDFNQVYIFTVKYQ